jgi:hypothetical protein
MNEPASEFAQARELMREQHNVGGEAATIESIGEAYFS